jgi:DNA sulfur modification protein DndE
MQSRQPNPFRVFPFLLLASALLPFILVKGSAAPLKITIASDSTAAIFPPTDYGKRTGWGQVLSNFFTTNVVVDDLASSGRSSKSFYQEGKWKACLATHANYYFIQFGHNDGKVRDPARYTDPETTFKGYLSNCINQARAQGGVPVLLTPPTRRNYQSEHELKRDDLQRYAEAMRELGTKMNVPVLDVLPASIKFYESVGKSGAQVYQANTATNTFENDATHFSLPGARQQCDFVVQSLLQSTDANLAPLRNAVNRTAVPSPVALQSQDSGPGLSWHAALPVFPAQEVSLANFGGVGDGATLNTGAFAKAIAALAEKGGGTLDVPPGFWLTGPIQLRSNINLHLETGALVQFSGDFKLYPLTVINLKGEKEVDSTSPISGENLENVAITGTGVLDGGGEAWRPVKREKLTPGDWRALVKSGGVLDPKGDTWWPSRQAMSGAKLVMKLRKEGSFNLPDYEPAHPFLRPKMLHLINCRKVLLEGVTFQNPPNWTLNPALCEDVSILRVQVHNSPAAQNSDALDLESCRRAIIRDCTFDAGDDGICLKSGKDAAGRRIGIPTEDVLIDGCTVYHAHGGFTIGSEMSGGVREVQVSNCTFIGTDVGLRFKSTRGRGGVVEKIYISGIRMKDIAGAAIDFNMFYGGQPPLDESSSEIEKSIPPVNEGTPQFRDIHIENVICRGAQKAIALEGLPEMPIRGITLKNVSLTAQTGAFLTDADDIHFENVRIENQTGPGITQVRVKNSSLVLVP